MTPRAPRRRIHIARLELDLRGIDPMTAEAAARALGGALARELVPHHQHAVPAERIDAGGITTAASPDARELASGIARQVARTVAGKGS